MMMPVDIHKGDLVEVRAASDDWLRAIAVSEIEGTHENGRKVHDFPVVWVITLDKGTMQTLYDGGAPDRIPWPVEDVRAAPPPVPDDMDALREMIEKGRAGLSTPHGDGIDRQRGT